MVNRILFVSFETYLPEKPTERNNTYKRNFEIGILSVDKHLK